MRKVALPSAVPALFASARISVPGALIGALLAEWLAIGQGIGSGMLTAIAGLRYAEMWASVVLVTGSSILLYALVGVVKSIVLARFGMALGRG
jgi:ABC-type nitrate/sulfonate/bicarbonate transport system permease component